MSLLTCQGWAQRSAKKIKKDWREILEDSSTTKEKAVDDTLLCTCRRTRRSLNDIGIEFLDALDPVISPKLRECLGEFETGDFGPRKNWPVLSTSCHHIYVKFWLSELIELVPPFTDLSFLNLKLMRKYIKQYDMRKVKSFLVEGAGSEGKNRILSAKFILDVINDRRYTRTLMAEDLPRLSQNNEFDL